MGDSNMKIVHSNYIIELQEEFKYCHFERIETINGMYITNNINISLDNDSKIFTETQVKRTLREQYLSPFVPQKVKRKLSYFSHAENVDANNIYKNDRTQKLLSEEYYAIQNIGHATQLIQLPGYNILTDPVFRHLNSVLYPEKTESQPKIDDLPEIDFIIISHNHRDHVDKCSLKKLLEQHNKNGWPQPQIFVPKGDKQLFKNFGYKDVEEVEWYTKISVSKVMNGIQKNVNFISIPADHRSGRQVIDHHKSLVTGWIVNPEEENVIFKFSGDTRSLSRENQLAVDAVLWYEIKNKINKNKCETGIQYDETGIPDIISLEPSGPNYTRCYMNITHQSTSYSALLKFVEAENLAHFSGLSANIFLKKFKTYMMHHRKFELGPDRFNEGLFVFKKLLIYLDLNEGELNAELIKQKEKIEQNFDKEKLNKMLPITSKPTIAILPEHTSLLVHAKDFIVTEIMTMINKNMDKKVIKECLLKNTIFTKIGERLNNRQIVHSKIDVASIPKYNKKR